MDAPLPTSLPRGPRLPRALQLARWLFTPTEFLEECAARYGETFTLRFPNVPPLVTTSSPDIIREVFTRDNAGLDSGKTARYLAPILGFKSLILLDGAEHRRHRKLLVPPLHGERMQAFGAQIGELTDASIDTWPVGVPFAIHTPMQKVTLETIFRIVFGFRSGEEAVAELAAALEAIAREEPTMLLMIPALQRDLGPLTRWRSLSAALVRLDHALYKEIARRRGACDLHERTDVLSLLLSAKDDAGEPLTDVELRDELVTLLFAGHETTATTLAWAFALVLSHPHVYARLEEELRRVVGDGPLTPAHVPALEYAEATIKETLRLYPVIGIVGRVLPKPMTFGEHALPTGTAIAPCIWLTHRRADLYPEPERFRPERFLGKKTDPYRFLPFGGGARRCIGMAFAFYEAKIVLAKTLLRTRLRLEPGSRIQVARRSITFAPKGGTRVILEERMPRR